MPPIDETFASTASLRDRLWEMESVFDAAPIGLCVLGLDFRYIVVNQHFLRLYGLTKPDFIGRTVEEVLPGPASQIMAHLRDSLAGNGIVEREIALESPVTPSDHGTSEEVIYLRTAQPVSDKAGNIYGIAVALLDITQRKKASAALRESEDNLRYTVELTPHIPWTADASGELTFMSPRWNTITGTAVGPEHLRQWSSALHPTDVQVTSELWRHSVFTGEPYDAEYRVRSVGGGWRWLRARAYPRLDSDGRIIRWYGTVEDIHAQKSIAIELAAANEELARRAQEDHLTGLSNRRRFDDVLAHEIDRARRIKQPLSVILLDIDYFKRYNDVAGHLVGDECLKRVASKISKIIRRPADLAARFGGDEFAIILPETSPAGAIVIADRAVKAVREIKIEHLDDQVHTVSISAGVAIHGGGDFMATNDCVIELLQAADSALYEAKANGRNCFFLQKVSSVLSRK